VFGARPLKRAIQERIENPLSRLILDGSFGPKDHVKVVAEWAAELRTFRRGLDRGARPGSTLAELIAAGRR
jgi:ATP-dependent Clp protease ATP-binding subunit ClpA